MASPLDNITQSPKFKSFMKKLALLGAVLTLVGLLMKLRGMSGGTLLITGMGMLAVVSYFLGWLIPCPTFLGMPIWRFAMLLTGFSLAVAILGVLFKMMHWPGNMKLLIAGLGGMVCSAVAWLWYLLYHRKHSDSNSELFED